MFRKYKVTVAAILTVVILITFTLSGFGLTAGITSAANQQCMGWDCGWFDLDTGTYTYVPMETPIPSDCDFHFECNENYVIRAVVVQNTEQGVEIAYSEENYANVEGNDLATLSFTTDLIDVPFDKVAVLHTPEGNYFKVVWVKESLEPSEYCVCFYWDQLFLTYDDGYWDGYQAGLDDSAENIDAFLEEIKNLLATPPGQRSSTSFYEGELGAKLNEIIEMLLAPPGSNISETTPHGKKK